MKGGFKGNFDVLAGSTVFAEGRIAPKRRVDGEQAIFKRGGEGREDNQADEEEGCRLPHAW